MYTFQLSNLNNCYRVRGDLDHTAIQHQFDRIVEHVLPNALDEKLTRILSKCGFSERHYIVIRNIDYRIRVHAREPSDTMVAEGWAEGIAHAILEKLQDISLNSYTDEIAVFENQQAAEIELIRAFSQVSTLPWYASSLTENNEVPSAYSITQNWINSIPEQCNQLLTRILVENGVQALNIFTESEAVSIFRQLNQRSTNRIKTLTKNDLICTTESVLQQQTTTRLEQYTSSNVFTSYHSLNSSTFQTFKSQSALFVYILFRNLYPGLSVAYESFVEQLGNIFLDRKNERLQRRKHEQHVENEETTNEHLVESEKIKNEQPDYLDDENIMNSGNSEFKRHNQIEKEPTSIDSEKQYLDVGCGGLLFLINLILRTFEPAKLLDAEINKTLSDLGLEILKQLLSGLPEKDAQRIFEREKILIKIFSGQEETPEYLTEFSATPEISELFNLLLKSMPDGVANYVGNIAFIYGKHTLPFAKQSAMTILANTVFRPGKLLITPTHADLYLPSNTIDLALRRVGLDLNPGWVPFLARVIQFHYQ